VEAPKAHQKVKEENIKMKSKGLGDSIEKFTKATGIKKAVDTIAQKTGKPCGCNERRDRLNRMFPYKK
jgi:hypothetical protein